MTKPLLVALLSGLLMASPAFGSEKKKGPGKKKPEATGAACKAPAVGTCAACSITCRAAETATCAPGVTAADACHIQPSCRCSK